MRKNRRKDFRVPFIQDIMINTILFADQYVELPKPIKVTTVNISCSGLLLAADLDLPPEICFCANIPFYDEIAPAIFSVVRKEQVSEEIWYYGCKFLQAEERSNRTIRRFIFEEQTKYLAMRKFAYK